MRQAPTHRVKELGGTCDDWRPVSPLPCGPALLVLLLLGCRHRPILLLLCRWRHHCSAALACPRASHAHVPLQPLRGLRSVCADPDVCGAGGSRLWRRSHSG